MVKYIWVDKNYNMYTREMITDTYLKRILEVMNKGLGWRNYITEETIDELFDEAKKRKIKHNINKRRVKNIFCLGR